MDEIKKTLKKMDRRRKAFKKLMKRKRIYGQIERSLTRRRKAEKRFKLYGMVAVAISLVFLAVLFFNIFSKGYSAFTRTEIKIPVTVTQDDINSGNYQAVVLRSLQELFPGIEQDRNGIRQLVQLVSKNAGYKIADIAAQGEFSADIWAPASSDVDMFIKGGRESMKLSGVQIGWLQELEKQDRLKKSFNTAFFTSGDSREPEMAGILGSAVGSLLVIISCMLLAFPLGTMTAIYLEEFAPRNRITQLIEVNINNLAAVPSIIYGLLGLTIYLQVMGIPRSAPLAGGLTLALMALPVIVIATRTSIRAIPQNIRDGALALGASKLQVILHHVLPLAMPGIMTGTILSVARVLGETAPLLMIGMVAFIINVPNSFLDPATALPVQIYLWSDSAEQGFIEKTSAAIIVLLVLLVAINAVAVYLRKKFEVRW